MPEMQEQFLAGAWTARHRENQVIWLDRHAGLHQQTATRSEV